SCARVRIRTRDRQRVRSREPGERAKGASGLRAWGACGPRSYGYSRQEVEVLASSDFDVGFGFGTAWRERARSVHSGPCGLRDVGGYLGAAGEGRWSRPGLPGVSIGAGHFMEEAAMTVRASAFAIFVAALLVFATGCATTSEYARFAQAGSAY